MCSEWRCTSGRKAGPQTPPRRGERSSPAGTIKTNFFFVFAGFFLPDLVFFFFLSKRVILFFRGHHIFCSFELESPHPRFATFVLFKAQDFNWPKIYFMKFQKRTFLDFFFKFCCLSLFLLGFGCVCCFYQHVGLFFVSLTCV